MPDKCCVPACRGNYTNETKISVFHFPRKPGVKSTWLRAICRDNFTPTDRSVVCEAHFKPEGVERFTSMYDSKTGRLLTAPLSKPRLREGAVPSLLPGCPSYLSKSAPSTSRECPEDRRERLDNECLKLGLQLSVASHDEHVKSVSLSSLQELKEKVCDCDLGEWLYVKKDASVCFVLLSDVPFPKVLCHTIIDEGLSLSIHVNDVQLSRIGNLKFPVNVSNTTQLTNILSDVCLTFNKREDQNIDDNIGLIVDALNSLSDKLEDKQEMITFLKQQVLLLKCNNTQARYSWQSVVLWSLVHCISPHCYKFLRSMGVIAMPNPATLSRICNKLSCTPIVEQDTTHFLSYLAKKVTLLSQGDRTVLLLMDEIHLKRQMDYKGGNIVGHAYNGSECATSAYVLMVRSLDTQYIDVAHILPMARMQAETLFLKCIILKLESIGFEVVGIVSDNNAINKKAVSFFSNPPDLKVKYEHPNPDAGNRPLYFVFDTVHLLKCIRNNWLNQKEQVIIVLSNKSDFNNIAGIWIVIE